MVVFSRLEFAFATVSIVLEPLSVSRLGCNELDGRCMPREVEPVLLWRGLRLAHLDNQCAVFNVLLVPLIGLDNGVPSGQCDGSHVMPKRPHGRARTTVM